MSIQFGRWNFDGRPIDAAYLRQIKDIVAPYAPDGTASRTIENVALSYGAFHTTLESRRETQPYIAPSGAVITWDGRLDNRYDLIRSLSGNVTTHSTDIEIVAAAFERWAEQSFAKLLGDWALAVWNPRDKTLHLAKDIIGIRHLYYCKTEGHVAWSTLLDPLVLPCNNELQLNEEYIAGWFSFFPAAQLTPYVGIHAVPPASFAVIQPGKLQIKKYWDFDPGKEIRYRTNEEYEGHFRAVLEQSVNRRLRSDSPIVAELSGGMDSSSIVCMADRIVASGADVQRNIQTMSIYDDSDPNWDERPYFTKIEELRGRVGYHVDASEAERFRFDAITENFAVTPGGGGVTTDAAKAYAAWLKQLGARIVLSGIGGDEVCGGVPTPIPELADLFVTRHWICLSRQLRAWALDKRMPWLQLLAITLKGFLPLSIVRVPDYAQPLSWLDSRFVKRNYAALQGYRKRKTVLGPLPSFQANLYALEILQRQIACASLQKEQIIEHRYPYLDRDLLEFSYAIPRDQLVRPGQRRSLMRRALAGVVPDELLNRKRKAYAGHLVRTQLSRDWPELAAVTRGMVSHSLGYLSVERFTKALDDASTGKEAPIVGIMRTLGIECWLRATRLYNSSHINEGPSRSPLYREAGALQTKSC